MKEIRFLGGLELVEINHDTIIVFVLLAWGFSVLFWHQKRL
jgi:hypothetical protein